MKPLPITGRTDRLEYERRIRPRSLLAIFVQKLLHILARFCIHGGLRAWLYRRMGVSMGRNVYIGLDSFLDDQFPELIQIEDDVGISFRVTIVVHDDQRRMDRTSPGRLEGTVAPVVLKRGCMIGAGSLILPGVTIGERSVIGAGSVVGHDVPPGKVAVGFPARIVKDVD